MANSAAFTTTEAAFVLQEPVKTVRKALDRGPVQARLVRRAGITVRAIEWSDLLYLYTIWALGEELTPKARSDFYQALKAAPVEDAREIRFGRLSITIGDLRDEVERRARELSELSEKVEFRADGEPILKGTDVEVYRISALLEGGMSPDEVCEDYPSLNRETIAAARAYAEAYPKAGRPYPARTVKRALQEAGLEALDEVLEQIVSDRIREANRSET